MSADIPNLKYASFKTITKLIEYRLNEQKDKKQWDLYLIHYQHMDRNNYKSFEEWKNPSLEVKEKEKTKEEIVQSSERINRSMQLARKNKDGR